MGPGGPNMGPGGPDGPGMMMGSRPMMGPGGPGMFHGMGPGGPGMMGPGGPGMMMGSSPMMGPGGPSMGGSGMFHGMGPGGPGMMGPGGPGMMGPGGPGMMGPDGPMGMNMGMQGSQMGGPNGPYMGPPYSMHSPMPQSSTPKTISTGPGSNSPHGSAHGSGPGTPIGPLSSGGGPNGPNSVPMGPSSHDGPPLGSNGMGSMSSMGPSDSPLTAMSSEKVYPPGQPMVFNPQNPSAPPIYPCSVCHKEVKDNDQAILCESGCNFWFHRVCTGLDESAFYFLTQEIYAEWVCDKCFGTKDVPLVKFKP